MVLSSLSCDSYCCVSGLILTLSIERARYRQYWTYPIPCRPVSSLSQGRRSATGLEKMEASRLTHLSLQLGVSSTFRKSLQHIAPMPELFLCNSDISR